MSSEEDKMPAPEPMVTTAPAKQEVIDEDGDLYIVVTPTGPPDASRVRFQVDSHVLYITSRVFRAMFGPKSLFREREWLSDNYGQIPTIPLYNDNPSAMHIVLNILHGSHDRVPKKLKYKQIVEVTILADKYELREPLEIWVQKWAAHIKPEHMGQPHTVDWFFVCWMFGLSGFSDMNRMLLDRAFIDDDGGLAFEAPNGTVYAMSNNAPPSVSECFGNSRKIIVDYFGVLLELFRAVYSNKQELKENGFVHACMSTDNAITARHCNALQMGDLIIQSEQYGLDDEQFWRKSITAITKTFEQMESLALNGHTDCAWISIFLEAHFRVKPIGYATIDAIVQNKGRGPISSIS